MTEFFATYKIAFIIYFSVLALPMASGVIVGKQASHNDRQIIKNALFKLWVLATLLLAVPIGIHMIS